MKFKQIIPYAFGVLLILGIGYYIGYEDILNSFKNVNFWFLPIIIASALLEYYFQVLRANVLFKATGNDVSQNMLKDFAIGQAVALAMPSRILGEIARIFALKQVLKVKLSNVFAAISVERILEILIFGITVICTSFLFAEKVKYSYLIGLIFSVLVLILIFMFVSNFVKKLVFFICDFLRLKRIRDYLFEYIESSKIIVVNRNAMLISFLYSIFRLFIDFGRVWLIYYMFGFNINFWLVAGVISLSYLLAIVFILPGGLGVFEGGAVAVFSYFGVPSSIAFSGMLIERILSYWLWIFLGFFYLSKKAVNINTKEVKEYLKKGEKT